MLINSILQFNRKIDVKSGVFQTLYLVARATWLTILLTPPAGPCKTQYKNPQKATPLTECSRLAQFSFATLAVESPPSLRKNLDIHIFESFLHTHQIPPDDRDLHMNWQQLSLFFHIPWSQAKHHYSTIRADQGIQSERQRRLDVHVLVWWMSLRAR